MNDSCEFYGRPFSRREMIRRSACGFGALALAGICADHVVADHVAADDKRNSLALRPPMFPPRAKRVIFIFMQGGPSHVDTFDFKPELIKRNGQEIDFTGVRFGTFGQKQTKTAQTALVIQAARAMRSASVGTFPAHGKACRQDVHDSLDAHRRRRARAKHIVPAHRGNEPGPAIGRQLDHLWIGYAESKRTGICHDQSVCQ